LPIDTPVSATHYEPTCDAPKDADEAALCEDRRANAVTESFSRINLWLSGLGLAMVAASLIYLARQTKATVESTKTAVQANKDAAENAALAVKGVAASEKSAAAAAESAEAARSMAAVLNQQLGALIASERAEIFVEAGAGEIYHAIEAAAKGVFHRAMVADIRYKNHGRTRATLGSFAMNFRHDKGMPAPVYEIWTGEQTWAIEAGREVSLPLSPKSLGTQDATELLRGERFLWVSARIEYTDAFGGAHVTAAWLRMDLREPRFEPWGGDQYNYRT
jgi:hypothetical protein